MKNWQAEKQARAQTEELAGRETGEGTDYRVGTDRQKKGRGDTGHTGSDIRTERIVSKDTEGQADKKEDRRTSWKQHTVK